MESPFDALATSTVTMFIEPIRNEYWRTYQNVITFSDMPEGPISQMVKGISPPKLTPFKSFGPFAAPLYGRYPGSGCTYVLTRYPNGHGGGLKSNNMFMMAEDLPSVFVYLRTNGYVVDMHTLAELSHLNVNLGGVSETRLSGN